MPLSWSAPSHRLMPETVTDPGLGTDELHRTVYRKWVGDTTAYYDLLCKRVSGLDIWETVYLQVLRGVDPVLEWVKETALRPIMNGLKDDDRDAFLDEYRRRLRQVYPRRPDAATLFPFDRLFIVAVV